MQAGHKDRNTSYKVMCLQENKLWTHYRGKRGLAGRLNTVGNI